MAYLVIGQKTGTVRFTPMQTGVVEKESESYSSAVTSNPIENGSLINDHYYGTSDTITISGVTVSPGGAGMLKAMREQRDIVSYVGVTSFSSAVITSLKFDRTYNSNSFSATLTKIQLVSSADAGDSPMMTAQDAGQSDDQQLAQTTNEGMTTVAVQSVSLNSAAQYDSAYSGGSSSSPFTRLTSHYDGLSD